MIFHTRGDFYFGVRDGSRSDFCPMVISYMRKLEPLNNWDHVGLTQKTRLNLSVFTPTHYRHFIAAFLNTANGGRDSGYQKTIKWPLPMNSRSGIKIENDAII